MKRILTLAMLIASVAMAVEPGPGPTPNPQPYPRSAANVQAAWARYFAYHPNRAAAQVAVLVTDWVTGQPVNTLTKANFKLNFVGWLVQDGCYSGDSMVITSMAGPYFGGEYVLNVQMPDGCPGWPAAKFLTEVRVESVTTPYEMGYLGQTTADLTVGN